MIISSIRNEFSSRSHEEICHVLCIPNNLVCVFLKFWLQCLAKCNGFGRNHLHNRPTLKPREDHLIDFLSEFLFTSQDHAATGTAESFVSCGETHIKAKIERILVSTSRNEPSHMRHIHNRDRSHLFPNSLNLRVIHFARVRRVPGQDHLRFLAQCHLPHFRVIELACLHILHLVAHELKNLRDVGDRVPMSEVTSVGEIHPEERVPWFHDCKVGCDVCRSAGMRLHIGMACFKELLCPINCNLLHNIGVLLPAVVALAWVPFAVLIIEDRPHHLHHCRGNVVLGRNEFHSLTLAQHLPHQCFIEHGVLRFECIVCEHTGSIAVHNVHMQKIG